MRVASDVSLFHLLSHLSPLCTCRLVWLFGFVFGGFVALLGFCVWFAPFLFCKCI